jgi:hypothetical protein
MNDVIQILGERWTYVYSSMYYGEWGYDNNTNILSTINQVSFLPSEIDQKIAELEEDSKRPEADPAIYAALAYLQKIKEKIG